MDGRPPKAPWRPAGPLLGAVALLALAACNGGHVDPDTFTVVADAVNNGNGRAFHAAVVVPRSATDWDVMLVGGQDADGLPLTADLFAERFRSSSRRFVGEQAYTSGTGRVAPVAAYTGGTLVAVGGQVTGPGAAATAPQYLSLGPQAVPDGERYAPATLLTDVVTVTDGRADSALTADAGGDLYLIGGRDQTGKLQAAILRYDAAAGAFTPTGASLGTAREGCTATLLSTGEILVAGGWDATGIVLASAELFDPGTLTVAPAAAMTLPRAAHTATPSADRAKVVLYGGFKALNTLAGTVASDEVAEIYDANAGTFTRVTWPTPAPRPRVYHAAVQLPNGDTLVVGGVTDDAGTVTGSAQEIEPETGTVRDTADSLAFPRFGHTATLLPDHTVLVAGGLIAPGTSAPQAERYIPRVR
jgi:Galactose oxidase, central domain